MLRIKRREAQLSSQWQHRQIDGAPRIRSNWVEAERLRRHAGGNCLCMVSERKVPASVVAAVVLTVVLALLIGGGLSFFGFSEGDTGPAIGGLVFGALLLALAWRLVRGGRGARAWGVVAGAAVVGAGFSQTQGIAMVILFALGLGLIVLLLVPASARAYYKPSPSSLTAP
jgi:hypothetical protein